MIFSENPINKQLHFYWRDKILKSFPELHTVTDIFPYSLISYLELSPQKFYNKEAYAKYLNFLNSIATTSPVILSDLLKDFTESLNHSIKILAEINLRIIHENHLPKNEHELFRFIDQEINLPLLHLYETPYFHFLQLPAKYNRIVTNRGTEKLDLFNVIQELQKTNFIDLCDVYINTLRNGIAHGKVTFKNNSIIFIDRKATYSASPRDVVRLFDKLLDYCNAFCLVYKVFFFSNTVFFETNKITLPTFLLVEELQSKIKSPGWEVIYTYESVSINDTYQLNILVENNLWDTTKVFYYCFQTAYFAEAITKSYGRVFLSLKSKYSVDGWAAFDANLLRELSNKKSQSMDDYAKALEGNIVFFIPKFKFPKFIYKLGTLCASFKVNHLVQKRILQDTYFKKKFYLRETKIHSKKLFTVVEDASVIIANGFVGEAVNIIRRNHRSIMNKTIQYSRTKCSIFSKERYLPVRYIRIFIYDEDLRERALRYSGLIPQLIATIEVNTTKNIKTIDIFKGTAEQIGKYRIVWFKGWRGNAFVDTVLGNTD